MEQVLHPIDLSIKVSESFWWKKSAHTHLSRSLVNLRLCERLGWCLFQLLHHGLFYRGYRFLYWLLRGCAVNWVNICSPKSTFWGRAWKWLSFLSCSTKGMFKRRYLLFYFVYFDLTQKTGLKFERFPFNKNSGLKFRKFHVPNGTVHSGCTDPTEATARWIIILVSRTQKSVLGTTILSNGKGYFGPSDRDDQTGLSEPPSRSTLLLLTLN